MPEGQGLSEVYVAGVSVNKHNWKEHTAGMSPKMLRYWTNRDVKKATRKGRAKKKRDLWSFAGLPTKPVAFTKATSLSLPVWDGVGVPW